MRFYLALASLFYLKRYTKRDDCGRAPVVSRLHARSTLTIPSVRCNTSPFEVLIPTKTVTTPPSPPI